MRARIDDLPFGGRTHAVEVSEADVRSRLAVEGDDTGYRGPAVGSVHLERDGSSLTVRGDVTFHVVQPCARCLEEVERAVHAPFRLTKLLGSEPALAGDDGEIPPDEVHVGPEIDLDDVLLEQVALETPTRLLCDETCRGLCPTCGANANTTPCTCAPPVDPRLAALAGWKPGDA